MAVYTYSRVYTVHTVDIFGNRIERSNDHKPSHWFKARVARTSSLSVAFLYSPRLSSRALHSNEKVLLTYIFVVQKSVCLVAACGSLTGACVRASAKLCSSAGACLAFSNSAGISPLRGASFAYSFMQMDFPRLRMHRSSRNLRRTQKIHRSEFYKILHWSGTALPPPVTSRAALKHRHSLYIGDS